MLLLLIFLLYSPALAWAAPWDIPAVVSRVYDADTVFILGQAGVQIALPDGTRVFIPTSKEIGVRVMGIDGPELRGSKCPQERALAEEGRDFVKTLLSPGSVIRLQDVKKNVYPGRIDATILLEDGRDLTAILLEHPKRLVVPSTDKRTEDWCK